MGIKLYRIGLIILGKEHCQKCDSVKDKIPEFESLEIEVEYRIATEEDIIEYDLKAAPTFLYFKDGKLEKKTDLGTSFASVKKTVESLRNIY